MSLAAWTARAARAPEATALRKLAKLPPSATGNGAAVPFPFRDRQAYKAEHTNAEIKAAIRKAPVQRIPLDDARLYSIQHSVKPARVAQYIGDPHLADGRVNPTSKTPADLPIVVEHGNDRYVHDGNHRLTAAVLEGHKTAMVRLVKLSKAPD